MSWGGANNTSLSILINVINNSFMTAIALIRLPENKVVLCFALICFVFVMGTFFNGKMIFLFVIITYLCFLSTTFHVRIVSMN